jgi:hypothetical protein
MQGSGVIAGATIDWSTGKLDWPSGNRIEGLLRDLPLLPEREKLIGRFVVQIWMAQAWAQQQSIPPFQSATFKESAQELLDLSKKALDLLEHLLKIRGPALEAFNSNYISTGRPPLSDQPMDDVVYNQLMSLSNRARLAINELHLMDCTESQKKGRPQKLEAKLVTMAVCEAFGELTGRPPGRSNTPDGGKPTGRLYRLLKEVFAELGIAASADAQLRLMAKTRV